jgi:hypothetical protein
VITRRQVALNSVSLERDRQERLRADGKFAWTAADSVNPCTGNYILRAEVLAVLVEEVGEVARVVCDGLADQVKLRAELCDTAAVCVAWIERLDREAAEHDRGDTYEPPPHLVGHNHD